MRLWRAVLACALLSVLLTGIPQARAGLTLVDSRGALGGDDGINWAQFGQPLVPLLGPQSVVSDNGDSFVVSTSGPFLTTLVATHDSGGINTGDRLLYKVVSPAALMLELAPGQDSLAGVGFDVLRGQPGGVTQLTMEAFDGANNSLGSVGTSLATGHPAIFLGVLSDQADISRIVLSSSVPGDFYVNQVELASTPIPAPAAVLLGGIGLAAVGWVKKRVG